MRAVRLVRKPLRLAALALAGALSSRARADEPPQVDLSDRHAAEAKALVPLLKAAIKENYLREAWYFAWRISAADPKNADALAFLSKWKEADLVKGNWPTRTWAPKRDAVLKAEGDAYAAEVRRLEAAGAKAVDVFPLVERALMYGSKGADILPALDTAGYGWAGTFGSLPKETLEAALGPLKPAVTYPPEWDGGYLYARALWPDAKILRLGHYCLVTSEGILAAGRRLAVLSALDATLVDLLGSISKDPKGEDLPPTYLLVAPDTAVFDRLGSPYTFDDKTRARISKYSTLFGWRQARTLSKDRLNPWTGEDAPVRFAFADLLVWHHLSSGGSARGRGMWIAEGIAGAFEGFVAKGLYAGEIRPDRCPKLAAARALRAAKKLLPWDQLVELDDATQEDVPFADVKVTFAGAEQDGLSIDVVVCQATALAMGLLRADGGKYTHKIGALVTEGIKRNHLPDIDKAMGWPKGRAFKEAEKAMDEVGSN